MIYFFLGSDPTAKDRKISELKKKVLKSKEALRFDYEVLHAHKLAPEDLKKALVGLPAVAPKRLLLIRECHRLSPHNKELIMAFAASQEESAVLILESEEMNPQDGFVKKLGKNVSLMDFRREMPSNVFDLTKAVSFRKKVDALKILSRLLGEGVHPLQIMGALVWSWGKRRERLSTDQFEEGLLALQEADLNIKRSRLRPDYALEVVVVRLCSLG